MAVPESVGVQEAQEYYDTADRIRIKPGWMQGEGQPMPEIEPYLWRWSQVEPLVMKSGDRWSPSLATATWSADHAPCGWRTVNSKGSDLRSLAPLQCLVDTEHQGAVAPVKLLKQHPQQYLGNLKGRPHRPVEHVMIARIVPVATQSHYPQRRGHRAYTRGQYPANQKNLGFPPSRGVKQYRKGDEHG